MFLSLCLLSFSGRSSLTFLWYLTRSQKSISLFSALLLVPSGSQHYGATRWPDCQSFVLWRAKRSSVWFQRRSTSTGPFLERNAFAHLYGHTVITLRAFCCEHRDDSGQRWLICLVLVRHKKTDRWPPGPICTVKKQSSNPAVDWKWGGPFCFQSFNNKSQFKDERAVEGKAHHRPSL